MKAPQLTPPDALWFCRHLAAALPGSSSLLVALETIAPAAPPSLRTPLASARARAAAGDPLSATLHAWGLPPFVRESVCAGEGRNQLSEALARVADRLETEASTSAIRDARLQAFSRAFGQLAVLLACGVTLVEALPRAAESSDEEVQEVLLAARDALGEGVSFGTALARLLPDLPPPALEMIRAGEEEGRLEFTLSVVSDYLLDRAQEIQEVCHG